MWSVIVCIHMQNNYIYTTLYSKSMYGYTYMYTLSNIHLNLCLCIFYIILYMYALVFKYLCIFKCIVLHYTAISLMLVCSCSFI